MATSTEIVADALRELNIVRIGGQPTAAQGEDGLRALNALLASWRALGVNIETADLPLGDQHEQALIALLAVRLATPYGRPISDDLRIRARDGWIGIQAEFIVAPEAQYDKALQYLPMQRKYGLIDD